MFSDLVAATTAWLHLRVPRGMWSYHVTCAYIHSVWLDWMRLLLYIYIYTHVAPHRIKLHCITLRFACYPVVLQYFLSWTAESMCIYVYVPTYLSTSTFCMPRKLLKTRMHLMRHKMPVQPLQVCTWIPIAIRCCRRSTASLASPSGFLVGNHRPFGG